MEIKDKVFLKEQSYLSYAVKAMEWEREHHKRQLATLPNAYRNDPRLLQILMSISAGRIKRIDELKGKPYFARIDFKELDKANKIYIGKTALTDQAGIDSVIDWRAPICSLYYDSNLGATSYIAPMGEINGELTLKRQLLMDDGVLTQYFDVDSVSDDELLKPYLGANADNRLKTIVASIGKEQNKIIRWAFRKNLIVQGVAGSGKTTVALHRAAYLIYNEKEKCKPSQFMVIGPNRFFIKYIATVLPDLEADDIGQSIFEDIATSFVGEKLRVEVGSTSLDYIMEGKEDTSSQKFKTSLGYKTAIDEFFVDFTNNFFNGGIDINGVEVVSQAELMSAFALHAIVPSLKARIAQTILTISNRIKHEPELLLLKIEASYKPIIGGSPKGEALIKVYDELHNARQEILAGCAKRMQTYFSAVNTSVTALYKQFAKDIERYVPQNLASEQMGKSLIALLNKKRITFEDAPAIIYLKLLLQGAGSYQNFLHILVDEAQDFGLFHFYCIKNLFQNSSFTIVGDLAQGIYSYRSIENWEQVVEKIFDNNCTTLYLEKSYRTTIEIMECANLALKALGSTSAVPVIRNGDAPRLLRLEGTARFAHIKNTITEYTKQGLQSFAIICKSENLVNMAHEQLCLIGVECSIINESSLAACPITVLTGYQAKGLEFDFVFILDADAGSYKADSTLDMRLLFVSMSRALHQMELIIKPCSKPALDGFLKLE